MRTLGGIDRSKIHTKVVKYRIITRFPKDVKEEYIRQIWIWVSRYVLDNNYPPYNREIAEGTNIPLGSISSYLKILDRRGYIEITDKAIRNIEVLRFPLEINNA